jgi:AcrR family transcriptional regulator
MMRTVCCTVYIDFVGARKPPSAAEAAARQLELLWRVPPARTPRGPRPTSSIDDVVAAAVAIADADGIDAVSIRAVAERLGVSPMSLYTYVPTKADLFALMIDDVHARMERTKPKGRGWRARVVAVAEDNRRLYEQHPWLVALPPNRPPLGPGTVGKYEYELQALADTNLDDVEIDAALGFVLGFVEACAHATARARGAARASAQTDDDWWRVQAPVLARLLDATKYPLATRVGTAAGEHHGAAYDPDFAYRFGLERVLAGLEALIERSGRRPASPRPKR